MIDWDANAAEPKGSPAPIPGLALYVALESKSIMTGVGLRLVKPQQALNAAAHDSLVNPHYTMLIAQHTNGYSALLARIINL